MKRIKIAFFAEILIEDFDGASRTMFQLINRIDKDKFDFLFICGAGPTAIRRYECIKIPTIHLPINTNYTMALPSLAKKELKKKLHDFDPDVIHIATPSLLGAFALKYANKHNIPVISIYHTHFISYIDYYFKYAPFLVGKVKQAIAGSQKAFYNHCDKVYIPAESIREELEHMGVAAERMTIWKRGIDTKLFSPEKSDKKLLYKLTGNNYPTILFASRLVWEKNLETLFRIYDTVQNFGLKINFLIAGDGIALKACKVKMKNAVFTGKVDHETLSILYASASLFLFTSVSETYGNVVLEAMASGLPCIIADGGGSSDFVEQGINGFKCAPFDEYDYYRRIAQLLNNESLKKQFISMGLQYSRSMSWDLLAATYFEDLGQMAGKIKLAKV
ncbi:glycosyltransferase [Pedobacter psychroterrae]|uniref:Glycosyltransferase family 1 protein n=1 Tax=Pedobacter psychroterrae TaxID=2530453 RepID=A0A4R0NUU4_9SPHI|nr:glycosyltransferase [Pedobacter psychroterrae]TCD03793.1 glycosyltransferase family 1 protein [Pedobacter psychroterrae]